MAWRIYANDILKCSIRALRVNELLWRHNGHDCVPNHQPHHCFFNCLFGRRSKKTSKLRVTGLCVGNSPGTGEFPAQMASNAENVSIWWRHHGINAEAALNIHFNQANALEASARRGCSCYSFQSGDSVRNTNPWWLEWRLNIQKPIVDSSDFGKTRLKSRPITMTSLWARWRINSPASPLFIQLFIRAQIKENIKAPRHWPLCGEIPRTNGQWRGKFFHWMTSSWNQRKSGSKHPFQSSKCVGSFCQERVFLLFISIRG